MQAAWPGRLVVRTHRELTRQSLTAPDWNSFRSGQFFYGSVARPAKKVLHCAPSVRFPRADPIRNLIIAPSYWRTASSMARELAWLSSE